MGLNMHLEVEIARRATTHALSSFACQADAGAIGNPRWYLYLYVLQRRAHLPLRIYLVSLQS